MATAYLLLGTNMGDRSGHLHQAVEWLAARKPAIQLLQRSSVFETAAWGIITQDDYLNQAIKIETTLSAEALLLVTAAIETKMGRIRKKVWEPRIIDIDILFYDREVIKSKNLIIPHPHLQERRFVLEPMAELAPDFIHPVLNKTIHTLALECRDPLWVRKYRPLKAKPPIW